MAPPFRLVRPLVSQAAKPRAVAFASRPFHSSASRLAVRSIKTAAEFKELISTTDKAVLVDCFAAWCGPCKAISPILSKMSDQPDFGNVEFVKFDVEELPELAATLGVRAMPTFFVFKDGKNVDELVGANPPMLERLVKKHA